MTWGMVAMAGAAIMTAGAEADAGMKQATNAAQELTARNKGVVRQNVQDTIRAGYRNGLLNLQEGLAKKNAVQKGFDTTVVASQALGAVDANAAATGTVGASVDAVHQDVQMRLGEAQAAMTDEFMLTLQNLELQRQSVNLELSQGVREAAVGNIPTADDIIGDAAMGAAISFASSYGSKKMSLGAGK